MIAAQGSLKTDCFETDCLRPARRQAALWFALLLASSLAGLLAFLALPAIAAETPRAPEPPVKIEVRAKPITSFDTRDPQRIRFGALEFRGGLELASDY